MEEKGKMEDLQKLSYIKENELPSINHVFYDNSDPYRIKQRWKLYGNPYNKDNFAVYSKCNLTNYDIIESDKNINSTSRRDYTNKCNNLNELLKENNEVLKKAKASCFTSKIDFLQDYKKDKEIDYNNENNNKMEKEKDDGLSRCYEKAHHDKDNDEVYKYHYLSTNAHDYTKKPYSKRESIHNDKIIKYDTIFRDNDELKKPKHTTYKNDYHVNKLEDIPHKKVPASNRRTLKLEDFNCEITNPYATESKDNYKAFPLNREIGVPDNSKHHFIIDPDNKENPFKTSMKTDYPLYDKYIKQEPCEKQNKAQFDLGYDTSDKKTLYNDTYKMTDDTLKNVYNNFKNIPKLTLLDNIKLDTENQGYKNICTTQHNDYKYNKDDEMKAYNDSKKIFNGAKEIIKGIPLNLSNNDELVKESLTKNDYQVPKVEEKGKFKRINPTIYDTNQYLKTNNKLNEKDDNPKLSTFQNDFVNYPNKYKYNPRRPPNCYYDHHLFHNDIYNDENSPFSYRTSYNNDYKKIDNPIKSTPYPLKFDYDTTLNEIFPKEVRNHSLKKESVTHKTFTKKDMEPINRVNKYEVEKDYVDIIEHNYNFSNNSDNRNISITHSSYIAPEIAIDRNTMPSSLRNIIN